MATLVEDARIENGMALLACDRVHITNNDAPLDSVCGF